MKENEGEREREKRNCEEKKRTIIIDERRTGINFFFYTFHRSNASASSGTSTSFSLNGGSVTGPLYWASRKGGGGGEEESFSSFSSKSLTPSAARSALSFSKARALAASVAIPPKEAPA